jgi:hypothetical protein
MLEIQYKYKQLEYFKEIIMKLDEGYRPYWPYGNHVWYKFDLINLNEVA